MDLTNHHTQRVAAVHLLQQGIAPRKYAVNWGARVLGWIKGGVFFKSIRPGRI
jgi:hypothetical protein